MASQEFGRRIKELKQDFLLGLVIDFLFPCVSKYEVSPWTINQKSNQTFKNIFFISPRTFKQPFVPLS